MDRTTNTRFGSRRSTALLLLILLAIGLCTTLQAINRPFWYDEICTVILSRLRNTSEIWNALKDAADTNPPLFYFIARIGRQLIPDDHLGYRLPSILGLLGTILCMYAVLARRVDRISALVGATFVLCTPLAAYGSEARPYALMVGCVSAALLAWQRINDSMVYSFVLAIALATALSLHYYAILVWPAFVLAEASVWIYCRRFRAGIWIALAVGATPLFVFADLLLHLRQYYGQNFWARPNLGQIFLASSHLFNFLGNWGSSFTIGAIVFLLCWSFGKSATPCSLGRRDPREAALPIEECVLAVALLLLPVMAVAAAKVTGGGMNSRYMLPTVLGGALAVGYLTSKAAHSVRALLLALIFVNYGLSSASVVKSLFHGSLLENRMAAARDAKAILAGYRGSGLPIVISSALQYLPMAYYTPADTDRELYILTDPDAADKFGMKSDSLDLGLLVLRRYFPLHVEDYHSFAAEHREFVLVSDGDWWDWWPSRLAHDGHSLSLVSADGNARIYKVILTPQPATGSGETGAAATGLQ